MNRCKIIRIAAAVVACFCALTLLFFTAVKLSLPPAQKSGKLPSIAGACYLPVTNTTMSPYIHKGGLALFTGSQQTFHKNEVVAFNMTPSDQINAASNSVFSFAVCYIYEADNDVYTLRYLDDSASFVVPQSNVLGRVGYSIGGVGSLVLAANQNSAWITMLLLPLLLLGACFFAVRFSLRPALQDKAPDTTPDTAQPDKPAPPAPDVQPSPDPTPLNGIPLSAFTQDPPSLEAKTVHPLFSHTPSTAAPVKSQTISTEHPQTVHTVTPAQQAQQIRSDQEFMSSKSSWESQETKNNAQTLSSSTNQTSKEEVFYTESTEIDDDFKILQEKIESIIKDNNKRFSAEVSAPLDGKRLPLHRPENNFEKTREFFIMDAEGNIKLNDNEKQNKVR